MVVPTGFAGHVVLEVHILTIPPAIRSNGQESSSLQNTAEQKPGLTYTETPLHAVSKA